jgi:hypothetical protein
MRRGFAQTVSEQIGQHIGIIGKAPDFITGLWEGSSYNAKIITLSAEVRPIAERLTGSHYEVAAPICGETKR